MATRRNGRRAVYQARGSHVRALLSEALQAAEHRTRDLPAHD